MGPLIFVFLRTAANSGYIIPIASSMLRVVVAWIGPFREHLILAEPNFGAHQCIRTRPTFVGDAGRYYASATGEQTMRYRRMGNAGVLDS
jgi:hypothetical protein